MGPSLAGISAPDEVHTGTAWVPDAGSTGDTASWSTPEPVAARPDTTWMATARLETEILAPDTDGCLMGTGDVLARGETIDVLAADENFLLLDARGRCLPRMDMEVLSEPHGMADATRSGIVHLATHRYKYGPDGCPSPVGPMPLFARVEPLARSHDANYRGFVVIDRDLGLAPVRTVDAEGWLYPWHAAVYLVRPVEDGYEFGGGVLLGPHHLLTAAHLAVDETFCYARGASAAMAFVQGEFRCQNIEASAVDHPDGIDLAVVTLHDAESPPYARVRQTHVEMEEAFYTARLGSLSAHRITDAAVASVSHENAWCQPWPDNATFIASEPVVEDGDSGSPAWIGDELVGVVHGERCRPAYLADEPPEHVFVHLPAVLDFLVAAEAWHGDR